VALPIGSLTQTEAERDRHWTTAEPQNGREPMIRFIRHQRSPGGRREQRERRDRNQPSEFGELVALDEFGGRHQRVGPRWAPLWRARAAFAFATWFGCGYAPVAPGTVGSMAALPLVWALQPLGTWGLFGVSALVSFLAVACSDVVIRVNTQKDPQIVVIDEVAGVLLTFSICGLAGSSAVDPFTEIVTPILAFVLFRLFDWWKPWPIRSLERLPDGWGVVLDDLGAAVWAGCLASLGAAVIGQKGWL